MLGGDENTDLDGEHDLIFILLLCYVLLAISSLIHDFNATLKDDAGQTVTFLVGDAVYSSITVALVFTILQIRVTKMRVVHILRASQSLRRRLKPKRLSADGLGCSNTNNKLAYFAFLGSIINRRAAEYAASISGTREEGHWSSLGEGRFLLERSIGALSFESDIFSADLRTNPSLYTLLLPHLQVASATHSLFPKVETLHRPCSQGLRSCKAIMRYELTFKSGLPRLSSCSHQ